MTGASTSVRSRRRLIRTTLVLLALVGLVWVGKVVVIDLYLVVEQSMWPGFAGDQDRILVRRLARRPRRWEIWLYEGEVRGDGPFVKRAVAFDGEFVDLRSGDLYVGSMPGGGMKRLRRPSGIVDAMLVPVYPTPSGACGESRFSVERGSLVREGESLRLEAGTVATLKSGTDPTSREDIHDDYLGNDGQFHGGEHVVSDVRVDVVVSELEPGGRLSIDHCLRGRAEHRAIVLERDTLAVRIGTGDRARVEPLAWDGRFPVGLRMETLDGRFSVRRFDPDSGANGPVMLDEFRDTQGYHGESRVRLQAERGGARLGHFVVGRDVYWAWPPRRRNAGPYHVGGGVFFLGDNAPVSEDSRETGPISSRRLIGRAWRIVWPRSRARVLR